MYTEYWRIFQNITLQVKYKLKKAKIKKFSQSTWQTNFFFCGEATFKPLENFWAFKFSDSLQFERSFWLMLSTKLRKFPLETTESWETFLHLNNTPDKLEVADRATLLIAIGISLWVSTKSFVISNILLLCSGKLFVFIGWMQSEYSISSLISFSISARDLLVANITYK